MRPYFFKRPTASEDKRAVRYQAKQRELNTPRLGAGRTLILGVLGILGGVFGANREVAAWLRTQDTGLPIYIVKAARDKSIEAAKERRRRRKARNLRWWANDKTWAFCGRVR